MDPGSGPYFNDDEILYSAPNINAVTKAFEEGKLDDVPPDTSVGGDYETSDVIVKGNPGYNTTDVFLGRRQMGIEFPPVSAVCPDFQHKVFSHETTSTNQSVLSEVISEPAVNSKMIEYKMGAPIKKDPDQVGEQVGKGLAEVVRQSLEHPVQVYELFIFFFCVSELYLRRLENKNTRRSRKELRKKRKSRVLQLQVQVPQIPRLLHKIYQRRSQHPRLMLPRGKTNSQSLQKDQHQENAPRRIIAFL